MAQGEAWQPTELDKYHAREAYLRYAAGVLTLHDPESMIDIHGRDVNQEEQVDHIVVHAKSLIWAGLSDVIRYSNPPERRSPITEMEDHYESALPNMLAVVSEVVEKESDRLVSLNKKFTILRPLPVDQEPIYKAIVHSRKGNVHVAQMTEPFTVSSQLPQETDKETFADIRRILSGARHLHSVSRAA